MPIPKMSPATVAWMLVGAEWKVLMPVDGHKGGNEAEQDRGDHDADDHARTPTAKRSRKAEAKQNLPYWRHMP